LLLGYAWLVIGLLLFGAALLFAALPLTVALHGITVGALGTLTLAVMARTRLLYRFRDANARPWIHPAAGLLTLAALARILPFLLEGNPRPWLLAAAGCWSLAYLMLFVLLWQTRGSVSPRSHT
ncbi:MAG TPA: NnrS family protein, partial [Pseudomonas sp.]|nr:NnrS family protein [Pseudomonas sp.]